MATVLKGLRIAILVANGLRTGGNENLERHWRPLALRLTWCRRKKRRRRGGNTQNGETSFRYKCRWSVHMRTIMMHEIINLPVKEPRESCFRRRSSGCSNRQVGLSQAIRRNEAPVQL